MKAFQIADDKRSDTGQLEAKARRSRTSESNSKKQPENKQKTLDSHISMSGRNGFVPSPRSGPTLTAEIFTMSIISFGFKSSWNVCDEAHHYELMAFPTQFVLADRRNQGGWELPYSQIKSATLVSPFAERTIIHFADEGPWPSSSRQCLNWNAIAS